MRESKCNAAFQKVLPSSEDMHVVKMMLLEPGFLEFNLIMPQEKACAVSSQLQWSSTASLRKDT